METRTYQVYTFNELPPEAQEKALQKWREGNDYPFLEDEMRQWLDEKLAEAKIEVVDGLKMFYSLGYCQGDGAMFEGRFRWDGCDVGVKHDGHYNHYNSKVIELTDPETGEYCEDEKAERFNTLYVDLCKDLAKWGYALIENEDDPDNIKETFEANGYMFTEDGRID